MTAQTVTRSAVFHLLGGGLGLAQGVKRSTGAGWVTLDAGGGSGVDDAANDAAPKCRCVGLPHVVAGMLQGVAQPCTIVLGVELGGKCGERLAVGWVRHGVRERASRRRVQQTNSLNQLGSAAQKISSCRGADTRPGCLTDEVSDYVRDFMGGSGRVVGVRDVGERERVVRAGVSAVAGCVVLG